MSTAQQLNFGRDVQGLNAYAPDPAFYKYAAALVINTATSFTVPSTYQNWIVSFVYSPGSFVWVDFTGVAAVIPVSASFSAVTVEPIPGSRKVKAGDVISVISASASASVGVLLYAVT